MKLGEDIIRDSSYYVYEDGPTKDSPITHNPGSVSPKSKKVTFYTFDGDEIITIKHECKFSLVHKMLDQTAHKPKPVSYRRVNLPSELWSVRRTEKLPRSAILYHDKNGNRIGYEWLKSDGQIVSNDIYEDYDLSNAIEETSNYNRLSMYHNENVGVSAKYCTIL
jgi:hypothetical protein